MAFRRAVEIQGLKPTLRSLLVFKAGTQRKILRPAMNKGTRLLAKILKKLVPVRKSVSSNMSYKGGQSKKSMASKVKTYKETVVGIVGPRKGYKLQVGIRVRGKSKGQPFYTDPINISHLIDLGHGGPHPASGAHFMQQAQDEARGPVLSVVKRSIVEGVEKEASRLRSKT